MSEEFTVYCLASGSSGNAILVTAADASLLVDAGLGVRTLKRLLEARGVAPSSLSGILLTHEHIDHVKGAIPFARKYNVPLVGTSGTLQTLSLRKTGTPRTGFWKRGTREASARSASVPFRSGMMPLTRPASAFLLAVVRWRMRRIRGLSRRNSVRRAGEHR